MVFGTRSDLDRAEKDGQRFEGRSRSPVVTRTRQILEEHAERDPCGKKPLEERHRLHRNGDGAWHDLHGSPAHHKLLVDDCTRLLLYVHRNLALSESIPNKTARNREYFARTYGAKLCAKAKSSWAVETNGEEERLMPSRACDVCYSWFRGKLQPQGTRHANHFQWRDFWIPDDALWQVC